MVGACRSSSYSPRRAPPKPEFDPAARKYITLIPKFSNELYAKADSRKPKPEFLDLVASAAALIFTLPKDEMLKGVSRCMSRMGIFRGDDVSIRYRRLDMNCTRTKTDASIAISRGTDQ